MGQLISLKEFFLNGILGSVRLSLSSAQVKAVLGSNNSLEENNLPSFFHLIYDTFNLTFRNSVLFKIQCDLVRMTYEPVFPSLGANVKVDSWIIWNGLTLTEAEMALEKEQIWCRKIVIENAYTFESDNVVELMSIANVRLVFREYLNWHLESLIISQEFNIKTPLEKFIDYYTY